MLYSFRFLKASFSEVNVSTTMYALASTDRQTGGERLKSLMFRTGTGQRLSAEALAEAVGVSKGTVGALMADTQRYIGEPKAKAIAAAIGVDLLVLWIPMERAGRVFIPAQVTA
jgi:transcriptional regulator with XRE-family HTH domain